MLGTSATEPTARPERPANCHQQSHGFGLGNMFQNVKHQDEVVTSGTAAQEGCGVIGKVGAIGYNPVTRTDDLGRNVDAP